jgi:hemolysin III
MTDGMKKAADAGRERATAAKEAMGERLDAAREATNERMEIARDATAQKIETAKEATGERVEAVKQAATEMQEKVKPKLRGWIHEGAFPVSLIAGAILVIAANGERERLALAIYALYHRVNWKRPSTRLWMRRLDHSMIFLLIAGTLTPFALLVLDGTLATAVLVAVWAGAAAGIVVELIWTQSPKWVHVAVYVSVGWIGAIAFPSIISQAGIIAGLLVAFGGVLYTVGAVVYARQRPDPSPAVFGYHEIFHVLVVAAAAAHFTAIALYAGPGA